MKAYNIRHTDLRVSRIGYGCGSLVSMRGREEPVSAEDVAKATRIINTAYDSGITLFDHADVYAFGKSEEAFGEVLKRSPGLREKIVIQTKCGFSLADNVFQPEPGDPHRLDFSREHIVSSVEGSLRRLATDHLDIVLLHRPDALVEPEEVAAAFEELHDAGKVRYFGVSNHTAGQIELLKKYVRQALVVNQLELSLVHSYLIADGMESNREARTRITQRFTGVAGTLDYCRVHDIQVQAFSPLGGRGSRGEPPKLLQPPADAAPRLKKIAHLLSYLAETKQTTPAAIALAWLLRHPAGIVPIIGATNPDHVIDSCAADGLTLSREEWYDLFVSGAGVSSLLMLGAAPPREQA